MTGDEKRSSDIQNQVDTHGEPAASLHESMATGKASNAKTAVGDDAVFAYIASLP
ncbi:MAG: hypothetical protein ACOH1T_08965 [Microbacteriaceae bacterium]